MRTASGGRQSSESLRGESDIDVAFLNAEPISRTGMDLLWLVPPHLAMLEQPLAGCPAITVSMGSTGATVQHREVTRADLEWAKRIEGLVDQPHAAGQGGEFGEAIRYYQQALLLAPGCDLLLMSVGVAYAQAGETATGLRYLERAAQLSPGNTRIRKNLEQVKRMSSTNPESAHDSPQGADGLPCADD